MLNQAGLARHRIGGSLFVVAQPFERSVAQLAGGCKSAISDLGVKLGPYPYGALDPRPGGGTEGLRQRIEPTAQHPHRRLRKSGPDRAGVAQSAVLFDGELEVGDPAAAVWLIADDVECVALNAFDLEPVLATARAVRQVCPFRDDALKLMRRGDQPPPAPSPSNSSLNRMGPLFGRPINCSSASRRSLKGSPRRSWPSRKRQSKA
jgi:hypothetical protein